MKTTIYYFTGTGNSLATAKRIAGRLGECELIAIASLDGGQEKIKPDAKRIGIVCPVYDLGIPMMVHEFAERLDISEAEYCFGIVTMGGAGASALHILNDLIKENCRRGLDSGFTVKMPANFPPLFKPPQGETKDKILRKAEQKIDRIAEKIKDGKKDYPSFTPFSSLFLILTYSKFLKEVRGYDKDFIVKDNCNSCGTCSEVCPAENIVITDGKPEWEHKCEMCFACLHFCPVEAIQWGSRTEGRGRYKHPDLKIHDMKAQRGEE
ncbi:MAG: EFR1 family ferrodoxin [Methanomicrobiaceae archaeon]|nr:EFR1 family ferrodoxin [Methanomicrobiaceae archaeon]